MQALQRMQASALPSKVRATRLRVGSLGNMLDSDSPWETAVVDF